MLGKPVDVAGLLVLWAAEYQTDNKVLLGPVIRERLPPRFHVMTLDYVALSALDPEAPFKIYNLLRKDDEGEEEEWMYEVCGPGGGVPMQMGLRTGWRRAFASLILLVGGGA